MTNGAPPTPTPCPWPCPQVPEAEAPYRRRVVMMLLDGLTQEDKPEDYRSALMPNAIDLAALNIQVRTPRHATPRHPPCMLAEQRIAMWPSLAGSPPQPLIVGDARMPAIRPKQCL